MRLSKIDRKLRTSVCRCTNKTHKKILRFCGKPLTTMMSSRFFGSRSLQTERSSSCNFFNSSILQRQRTNRHQIFIIAELSINSGLSVVFATRPHAVHRGKVRRTRRRNYHTSYASTGWNGGTTEAVPSRQRRGHPSGLPSNIGGVVAPAPCRAVRCAPGAAGLAWGKTDCRPWSPVLLYY